MAKATIFLSHINEEAELAGKLKSLLEDALLGGVEVFVSSERKSIGLGRRWLDAISKNLSSASAYIVLCSPHSVLRPWINFEAGAGFVRDVEVVPACHSGLAPGNLPSPLNFLQAMSLNDAIHLKHLLDMISNKADLRSPAYDFSAFINDVKTFEEQYTFWDEINSALPHMYAGNLEMFSKLFQDGHGTIHVSQTGEASVRSLLLLLQANEIISFKESGSLMSERGFFIGFDLTREKNFGYLALDACAIAAPLRALGLQPPA